jgi:adenylylsulfate kinase
MSETFSRSLMKTIVWRVLATIITFIVVYVFTGHLGDASIITITAATFLAIGYYFHERMWDKIHWGRRKKVYSK